MIDNEELGMGLICLIILVLLSISSVLGFTSCARLDNIDKKLEFNSKTGESTSPKYITIIREGK